MFGKAAIYRFAANWLDLHAIERQIVHDRFRIDAMVRAEATPGAPHRLAFSERRAPGAQPRRGFEGGADTKHRAFIEGAADDLHRQR